MSKTEGDAWDNFGRFPEELEEPAPAECYVCGQEDDDTAADVPPSIICDRCESSVHLHCLDPPTKEVPEGEFTDGPCLFFEAVADLSMHTSQANSSAKSVWPDQQKWLPRRATSAKRRKGVLRQPRSADEYSVSVGPSGLFCRFFFPLLIHLCK